MSEAETYSEKAWRFLIPPDWKIDRLGKFAEIIVSNVDKKTEEGEVSVRLCNYVDVYKNDRITADISFMEASATPHEIKKFTLQREDVIATKDSENPLDIAIPSLVTEDLGCVLCGYHLAILRPEKSRLFGPYLSWLHVSQTIRTHYEMHATGITRWAIGRNHFKTCPVPLPPLLEQKRIAAYLDASCAAIDRAVETKKKQLETLGTLRKSIIQRAVTQGLNPKGRVQESGCEWLGPIPAQWKVQKLKRVFSKVEYGISQSTEQEGTFAVLKMGNIVKGEIVFTKIEFVSDVTPGLILEKDDLLFNRTNSLDQVAKVAIFRGDKTDNITFASYLVRMRANYKNHPSYLNHLLNAEIFLGLARKMAIPSVQQANLNPTRYCRLEIPVPPLAEQIEIAAYLDTQSGRIRKIEQRLNAQITTLTAYRKSLIHECVTGKRRISDADIAGRQTRLD